MNILDALSDGGGALPMLYADDAILSSASLELRDVPEPDALMLLGLGLAAVARRRRR